ncbi:hypothetical protein BDV35DRAFT_374884 [Aspergillus flavus]|uniref:Uncharacterized protein n=1 Tax=Aspergillus flavus TaxID=5059 RepID=A0A5N6GFP0_ASPFL|nr:hypothetical protein BDV35DRAFT_374884 [Aspergillus flavus]
MMRVHCISVLRKKPHSSPRSSVTPYHQWLPTTGDCQSLVAVYHRWTSPSGLSWLPHCWLSVVTFLSMGLKRSV